MDVAKEVNDIIRASIDYAQKTSDEANLTELLRITRDFLFILDTDKAPEYKMALLEEYLEDIAAIVPVSQNAVLLKEILSIKDRNQEADIAEQIHTLVAKFFDPNEVNPHLVTFWLDTTCDLQQIKNMAALMLMLDSSQQQRILSYDKQFMNDQKFQQLRTCLPKE